MTKRLMHSRINYAHRVKQKFLPPWDALAPAQRRSVALQWDYQTDPATQAERKFWWDFSQKMDAIKQQIAEWEAASAPAASDLALKEARLKELRQELARMASQERQARSDYYPGRVRLADTDEAPATPPASPVRYMAYPKAMGLLAKRPGATPEELAAWVFFGRELGGLAAFLNGNELDPPPPFITASVSACGDNSDYLSPLMGCWFRENEIAQFEPAQRYITGKALIERWSKLPGIQPKAFIRAKITESRFMDMHPITGLTRGSNQKTALARHWRWLYSTSLMWRRLRRKILVLTRKAGIPPSAHASPSAHGRCASISRHRRRRWQRKMVEGEDGRSQALRLAGLPSWRRQER